MGTPARGKQAPSAASPGGAHGRARSVPQRLGRYEIVAPIASGGMASVHLARRVGQAGLSRAMALKLLHPHLLEDPEFVGMFLDEARIAARIRHGNVVDVYDVESIDCEMVIAMAYVEGASLQVLYRAATAKKEPMARGLLLRVARDMLRGLHAAHEVTDDAGEPVGLVHRDVSPQNILVGVDGVSRVTDFGIAKARGRSTATRTGMVKGKLQYLAPEQLRGLPIDRRVDVFAAGVVLWEALTGKPLFRADHEAETMMLVLQKAIPPPSSLAAGVRIAMDRVCLRALERDPNKRFPSTAAFADALEDASAGELLRAKEVGEAVERLVGSTLEPLRRALRVPLEARAPEAAARPIEIETRELPTEPLRLALDASPHDSTHTRLRASDAGTEVMDPPFAAERVPPAARSGRGAWVVGIVLLALGAAAFWIGSRDPATPDVRAQEPEARPSAVQPPPVQPAVEKKEPEPPPSVSVAPPATPRPARLVPARPPVQDRPKPKGTAAVPFMPPDI